MSEYLTMSNLDREKLIKEISSELHKLSDVKLIEISNWLDNINKNKKYIENFIKLGHKVGE